TELAQALNYRLVGLTWIVHIQRIAGLVLLYLKTNKLMDRLNRIRVIAGNLDCCATFGLFETVGDLVLQFLHYRYTRRRLLMDKHRSIEVSIRKHPGDVAQVRSDLDSALDIVRAVCADFD